MNQPYDKVKYTWLRYVILFMCRNPKFRSKFFLWIFRNWNTHICYKNGKIVQRVTVKHIAKYL
jgi:hypothetical protein